MWSLGYGLLCCLLMMLLWLGNPSTVTTTHVALKSVGHTIIDRPILMIFLAAVPTFFLATATEYLSKSVASFPLLWILPLSAYLLSFVVAFHRNRPALPAHIQLILIPVFLPTLFLVSGSMTAPIYYWVTVLLVTFGMFLLATLLPLLPV